MAVRSDRKRCPPLLLAVGCALLAFPAAAQTCTRSGSAVTCGDGRTGLFAGDAIIWPDGTKSYAAQHPSVIIGNRAGVSVGPGVFVGRGGANVPLDDPNAPHKNRCAVLDSVPYCH